MTHHLKFYPVDLGTNNWDPIFAFKIWIPTVHKTSLFIKVSLFIKIKTLQALYLETGHKTSLFIKMSFL
jgi:hypothetical protein